MPSLLYHKLADTIFRYPHTPQVDGTVSGKSGNRILISFHRPPHSGPLKASKVGSSASSFHISKVSVREKGIGKSRRRHGSCEVLLDGRTPLIVDNRTDRRVRKFRKATEAEVQSCGNDN